MQFQSRTIRATVPSFSNKPYLAVFAAFSLGCLSTSAFAATVLLNGVGAVVTSDRIATFDSLVSYNNADLSTYTENNLYINTPTTYANFNDCTSTCWYANTGYWQFPTIAENLARIGTTDGKTIYAAEFSISSGAPFGEEMIYWQTYRNGGLLDQGSEQWGGGGSTVGWKDSAGFDELRVGLYDPLGRLSPGGGINNVIAIDNLKVQLSAPVPVPAAAWLLGSGLLGLVGVARRKAA